MGISGLLISASFGPWLCNSFSNISDGSSPQSLFISCDFILFILNKLRNLGWKSYSSKYLFCIWYMWVGTGVPKSKELYLMLLNFLHDRRRVTDDKQVMPGYTHQILTIRLQLGYTWLINLLSSGYQLFLPRWSGWQGALAHYCCHPAPREGTYQTTQCQPGKDQKQNPKYEFTNLCFAFVPLYNRKGLSGTFVNQSLNLHYKL